jgi:hypothetical protein
MRGNTDACGEKWLRESTIGFQNPAGMVAPSSLCAFAHFRPSF